MEEAARRGERRESETNASRTPLPWKKMGNRRYWEVGRLLASSCCFLQRFTDRPPGNKNPFPTAIEQGRGKKRKGKSKNPG